MIYKINNIYCLKKGSEYEIANIEIKYSRIKRKNILVINGSDTYVSNLEGPIIEYTFKDLEEELVKNKDTIGYLF